MYLSYYQTENEEFKEEHAKQLPNEEAVRIVIKKLLRHYKLGDLRIEFTSGRNHSCAGRWLVRINIEQMNFLVLCHEVAHTYQTKKEGFERGDHWHTKKHRRIMKRMLSYCKKKNWFEDEIKRRCSPKEPKPEPSKNEIRSDKIALLENRIKLFEKKVKFYTNKIKKVNKRVSALKRFV